MNSKKNFIFDVDSKLLTMNKKNKNEINEALDFDGLHEAEKLTGKSYKEDDGTSTLGLFATLLNNQMKNKMLSSLDDTIFSETEEEYLRKVTDFGFEVLLKETFMSKTYFEDEEPVEERFYIMFHRKYSILLTWDTFRGHRNGGNFYYNWSAKNNKVRGRLSSGHYIGRKDRHPLSTYFNQDLTEHVNPDFETVVGVEPKWDLNMSYKEYRELHDPWYEKFDKYVEDNKLRSVWSGHHDCREAIKHNINSLAEDGDFLPVWKEAPFLWLIHHGERENDVNYKEINDRKIALLPQDIQDIIKGDEKYDR